MGTSEAPAGTTRTTKCADWQQQARAQGTVSPRTSLRNSSRDNATVSSERKEEHVRGWTAPNTGLVDCR